MENYLLEMKDIAKIYGNGIVANEAVNFNLKKGEVHALVGENGAGKSTLMKILFGMEAPSSGTVTLKGEPVRFSSSKDAIAHGIGMVHQHFMLVESFTAAQNIILGMEPKKGFSVNEEEAVRFTEEISKKYNLEVDARAVTRTLPVGIKQKIEILKALARGAEILILDEPTAVLTPQETQKLFQILRKMKEQGCAVIIITHKLHEVLEISDRVTILRKGKSIDTVNTAETDEKRLTELMVGKAVSLEIDRPPVNHKSPILKVVNLTVKKPDGTKAIDDISFEIRKGEILGVAGVAGSGQKELCEAIAGLMKIEKGAILYEKENIIGKTPAEIIQMGISMSFVPEDRLGMGLVASMDMVENMMLKSYKKGKGPFVDRKPARELANRLVDKLGIVTPGVDTPVRLLSGGNVQKVLLGREIESCPNLLITAYPVRGLDINSSYTIYDLLNEQKKKDVAVIFIGEDLDVLLELSDVIMVLCHGRITGFLDARKATKEQVGLYMTGAFSQEVAQ